MSSVTVLIFRTPRRWPVCALLIILMLFMLGFGALAAEAAPPVLAEIDGEAITNEEVERALGGRLQRLEEQLYELKRQKLEEMIDERLLARAAAARGLSVQALLAREADARRASVTDDEVRRFYEASRHQLRGSETELRDQIRGFLQIRAQLQDEAGAESRKLLLQSLRSQSKVLVHLTEPRIMRVDVSTDGAPILGPTEAPVTIVEFSDFHCPFCKRVLPALAEVRARYGDKVKLVFRDFPIDRLHPQARRAAEAARCAHDQDKFWKYHDLLFASAPQASAEHLTTYAKQVGLDVPAFERCLASGQHAARVQRDVDEGSRLGVSGTPAFFVNGRLLSGAQPVERFVQIIEDELRGAK